MPKTLGTLGTVLAASFALLVSVFTAARSMDFETGFNLYLLWASCVYTVYRAVQTKRPILTASFAVAIFAMLKDVDERRVVPDVYCGSANSSANCSALVTGANSGVGRAVAAALVAQGWTVVLGCRSQSKCAEAAAAMNLASPVGRAVSAPGLDLSSLDAVRAWVADAGEMLQGLNLLVNNAGLTPVGNRTMPHVAGLEEGFAVMHISHFALTKWLRDAGRFSPNATVVQVACSRPVLH